MSCWRVLELSEQPEGEHIPQLLVKPIFRSDSYTVHLTCLSNIWSEQLDLAGIVDRASQEQSPIEVSKQDTVQLAILLENVKNSLLYSEDAFCRITRNETDGLTLHTSIMLPKPLDCLAWKFNLEKRPSTALKNELILPLLMSSHIQHERIAGLVSTIRDKDKAITRLIDQYESSNLDLAAAFPVIGGLKTGRKVIKREQAAKHIPALQPFREHAFKQKTALLLDSNVSTLGLFQEALSECTPQVPSQLKSDDANLKWWSDIPNRLSHSNRLPTPKAKRPVSTAGPPVPAADSSDDETEDEFENHANFKTRILPPKAAKALEPDPEATESDDATEDDDDLDAPPKSQSQTLEQPTKKSPFRANSSTPEDLPSPRPDTPPAAKSKVKGFRIGGKVKQVAAESPPPDPKDQEPMPSVDDTTPKEPLSSQMIADVSSTPKKPKKTFKIGGKGKGGNGGSSQVHGTAPQVPDRTRDTYSPSVAPPSSPPVEKSAKEPSPIEKVEREETAEEKAERRRAELKRKTEEAAKKQAQSKKKRRF